ncbi:MAG: chemotaxis response regulator protein-glutamate methylesterase [Gammaproteobacteria bacterium]|nr:chemotaxis response regulator protein-glutamate methylesterase [Gammaproteobacteria bacterium]
MIDVLVVDDSALIRQLLSAILSSADDINVIATASDPYVARDKIKQLNPDVLTLDIEMPRMDGVTFLGNLMRLRPMPVVMVSTLTDQGADITLRALELGAVDFIAKPKLDVAQMLPHYAEEIVAKVRAAANASVKPLERSPPISKKDVENRVLKSNKKMSHFRTTDRIIGIGSSTGGTEAIKDVLRNLSPDMPGIVISQHIPAAFSAPFAERVNGITDLSVMQAVDGQQILSGHVYIAPGDAHLLVRRDGARYVCALSDAPEVNRHRPSVDVMFRSLAQNAGSNAIAVMLTGMGADGAKGMGEMKEAGAQTLAQDENSSVVWGMPGEAYKRGFVDELQPLLAIGERLRQLSVE